MFLVNSRYPLVCAPSNWLPRSRASFFRSYGGNLPSSFSIVLSNALVFSTSPPVSVSGTVSTWELFPETPSPPVQSDKDQRYTGSVTTHWRRNIHLLPIGYAFQPHPRGRLTLRRLALRRNPWTFGDSVSHTVFVTHVSIRTSDTSRRPHGSPFTGLRNAPLPLTIAREPAASASGLSPVTLSARQSLFRPVSCYAFFK